MARPAIESHELSDDLTLSLCHPDSECRAENWWLYDRRAGMNLAMRTKTREDALLKALEYWAERSERLEDELFQLRNAVDQFVDQVRPDE